MPKRFEQLRVRLLQVRLREDILAEEQGTFRDRCGLSVGQLLPTNVIRDPLTPDLLDGVDAVMIGGAGAYSVTRTYPWTRSLVDFIEEIDAREIPLFGSCWGHQFIARAYGGRVVHDPERTELGCHWVHLTEPGQTDPLFSDFPASFRANMGHQDRVAVLPDSAVELATNDTAPFQAFRIDGKPIYGTQFHSELNAECERQRLIAYREHYAHVHDDEVFERIIATLAETTEVDRLLRHFLERFALDDVRD